ncbi:hypothetical protein TrispH2_003957 [Trichoplax sp. H2]|nr:hypothetical protein TrispH2_003957 [Trichoplax sp. H2]|eukprot:RDD43398.1 hypothetical protein TrispH2_003957 [Trichoplax sp. H2]
MKIVSEMILLLLGDNGFGTIKSPLLQGNDYLCLKISCLIVGNTTSLAITTSFNGKIWSKDGRRLPTWRKIYIIASHRGGSGEIALDDIQLVPGKCRK